jgi:hypothetical protein
MSALRISHKDYKRLLNNQSPHGNKKAKKQTLPTEREDSFQKRVALWLDEHLIEPTIWFHAANGGKRTAAEAGILKAMGVKPGVPDICILVERHDRPEIFFIELKRPGANLEKSLSKNQIEFHQKLSRLRVPYAIANDLAQIEGLLRQWKIPFRQ